MSLSLLSNVPKSILEQDRPQQSWPAASILILPTEADEFEFYRFSLKPCEDLIEVTWTGHISTPYTVHYRKGSMVPPMSNSTPPRSVSTSALTLKRQLAELTKNPVEGFSAGAIPNLCDSCLCLTAVSLTGLVDDSNFYEWEIMIIG